MSSQRRITFYFPLALVLFEIAVYLGNDMYLPALPQMRNDLGLSNHLAQFTLTSWFIGSAAMQLFLGPLSDRYGRRPVLLVGGLVFLFSTAICAFTQTLSVFLFARFLQGTAVAPLMVAGYASIHELLDQKQAIKIIAWMSSISLLAPALGPLAGSLMVTFTHWRMIFWFLFFWGLLAWIGLFSWMPESNAARKEAHPLELRRVINGYREILSTPLFLSHIGTSSFLFCGIIVWLSAGPFLTHDAFKLSEVWFGGYQFVLFGAFVVGTRIVNHWIESTAPTQIIQRGILLALIGGLGTLFSSVLFPKHFSWMVACLTPFMLAAGLSFSPLQRLGVESCEDQPMGLRMALYSTSFGLFGTIGSLLVSVFYRNTLLSVAGLIAIFALIAFWLQYRVRLQSNPT